MTYHFNTRYLDDDGTIQLGRYHDGSIALKLFSPTEGPLSTATVCLSEYGEAPADGHVFIKDYSENEGTLNCLIRLGVIGAPIRTLPAGFGEVHECELFLTLDRESMTAS